MCKIMIIPGLKPEYAKAAKKFVRHARPQLTENDKDAFGYAALGNDGRLFGERWTDVREAFRDATLQKSAYSRLRQAIGNLARFPSPRLGDYSAFGDTTDTVNVSTWLLHSRWATCGKSIENAHPFVRDGHALIHNGVISNHASLKKITSTCDSEVILNAYVDRAVADEPDALDAVNLALRGWYAVAVLAPTRYGYVVDLFRDDTAPLFCAYIPQLDNVVFCTSDKIIVAAAKSAGMSAVSIHKIPDGTHLRLDAYTGDLLHTGALTLPTKYVSKYVRSSGSSSWQWGEDDIPVAAKAVARVSKAERKAEKRRKRLALKGDTLVDATVKETVERAEGKAVSEAEWNARIDAAIEGNTTAAERWAKTRSGRGEF